MPTTTSYECGEMLKMPNAGTKECHPATTSLVGNHAGCGREPRANTPQTFSGLPMQQHASGLWMAGFKATLDLTTEPIRHLAAK